jgi:hypothetical protein
MTAKKTDAGEAEVQKKVDAAEEKGFIGEEVDPIDNDRYSIKTGPDSPTAEEQRQAVKENG